MIKLFPIILIFLSTFFGFNFRNQHSNIPSSKEKQVIYYSEILDSISIDNDIYCRMEFKTRRDITQFQEVLKKLFGKPKIMEQYWDDDCKCGKFQWKNVDLEGFENIEIILNIFPANEYNISIGVFNKEKINIITDPKIETYFRKLITDNILNQPIKITKIGRSMPLQIDLSKIMAINEDSLLFVYDSYFSLDTLQIKAKINVNKEGRIFKTEIEAPYKLIPEVENFIAQLNMPIIIYQEAKDTAVYEVSWNFTCSENRIIELAKKEMQYNLSENHWSGMDTSEIDFSNPVAHKYMYGNLFEKDKIHCIINIPEYSSIYVYTYSENMFIEKAHIKTLPYYDFFYLDDVTFDQYPEIITITYANMNGNCYVSVYSYKNEESKFVGNWAYGQTTFNEEKKEIYELHGGSWYTPVTKTVYGLINNQYIPKRQIEIRLKEDDMECPDQILYYHVNPFFESGIDTLILKLNVRYNENNKNHQKLWNNFFEDNY